MSARLEYSSPSHSSTPDSGSHTLSRRKFLSKSADIVFVAATTAALPTILLQNENDKHEKEIVRLESDPFYHTVGAAVREHAYDQRIEKLSSQIEQNNDISNPLIVVAMGGLVSFVLKKRLEK